LFSFRRAAGAPERKQWEGDFDYLAVTQAVGLEGLGLG
jgi:hypothetical protein